jgi:hypothetical protein
VTDRRHSPDSRRQPSVSDFLGDDGRSHEVRAFSYRFLGPVRVVWSFLGNWLTAAIGTAIAEAEFKNFYHPHTFAALYMREMLLSVAGASLLGWFVYQRWRCTMAKWIWTFGACYLAWRIGVRLAPKYVFDWDPVFNEG